ncbi:alpha/beta fold hydrolase [Pseudodesulfovibrio cashew]|uniref:Alpha/beta fold hydrolase n=1 Tax=Pseudodesulfovibrio cashew TaxID=2678688 RepID=A0A6I6JH18_9BACT|nr:alpha/beta hydrolase [Pseudodesulfovibrio cashew]QGY40318.1 alpha/beta fold hydrolase [Pseudodesulfovibrio cashew]
MALYGEFTSQAEIDREYNAVGMVADLKPYIDFDAKANAEARGSLRYEPDIPYGAGADETLDIFPAESPNAPVLIFIHGGYWRSMSSKDFSLVAKGLAARGVTVVIPDYSLCPSVDIPEITRQTRAATAWVHARIAEYNGSPDRIFACGHSAGGQQAGMLAATDWEREHGMPRNAIKGVIPISGLFDLAPLRHSWLQPVLQLDAATVEGQSPLRNIPHDGPPMLVSVGDEESSEFKRQAEAYAEAWRAGGNRAELVIQEARNHFTSFRDLNDPDAPFTRILAAFMETCLQGS